ncbi:hypothetical protein EK21DRAFT_88115 [Setomelanomma holmii]|uniref:RRM domain-containing protein n=1 Tax=Setomelanomma holmii TaxID=210430 RepID=A0A9P4HB42_9PLEO|nr:hypothetical protein EK21DRAFT_88115 [Setomelanomma holmii]
MSHHSPQSSVGNGPVSSPFAGTEATLYSPEASRNTYHRCHDTGVLASINHTIRRLSPVEQPLKGPCPMAGLVKDLPQPTPYVPGNFNNELDENDKHFISRYQAVLELPDGIQAGDDPEHELFSVQHVMKIYDCFNAAIPAYARGVYLRYDDLHDAKEGKKMLTKHGFMVKYITSLDYNLAKCGDNTGVNVFEGQMSLSILIRENPDQACWEFGKKDVKAIKKGVEQVCGIYGSVRAVMHVDTLLPKMHLVFRVEFHSIDAANRCVSSLALDPVYGKTSNKSYDWATIDAAAFSVDRYVLPDRGLHPPFFSREKMHPADQHNKVIRKRIDDGSDVRTTIMLRNIPNKMDWLQLKAILDAACFGSYDFVYLRIDFKSACNVGYAFINFHNVRGIAMLMDKIQGRLWLGFRSVKAAEISYATIQGREALVQKFRNSSVMQETPFCRPRLFLTYSDAEKSGKVRYVGMEQSFPQPDNLSKLQRSMDSARTIGLYPPHNYLSSITEHRMRSSPYDRGTPRDVLQATMHYARQRAAPAPLQGLSEDAKHDIEVWYSVTFGQGFVGIIPFDYIPMTHVAQYFAEHQSSPLSVPMNHGVIGGSRINDNSAYARSAHTLASEYGVNPFM